ncbi:MAG: hypothetical protein CMJ83_06115 [Planctomycetes bacterium]|nr:hypothetical protein [Planctomycetota bacterium]
MPAEFPPIPLFWRLAACEVAVIIRSDGDGRYDPVVIDEVVKGPVYKEKLALRPGASGGTGLIVAEGLRPGRRALLLLHLERTRDGKSRYSAGAMQQRVNLGDAVSTLNAGLYDLFNGQNIQEIAVEDFLPRLRALALQASTLGGIRARLASAPKYDEAAIPETAMYAIGRLGTPDALEHLAAHLSPVTADRTQRSVARALLWLGSRDAHAIVDRWWRALDGAVPADQAFNARGYVLQVVTWGTDIDVASTRALVAGWLELAGESRIASSLRGARETLKRRRKD